MVKKISEKAVDGNPSLGKIPLLQREKPTIQKKILTFCSLNWALMSLFAAIIAAIITGLFTIKATILNQSETIENKVNETVQAFYIILTKTPITSDIQTEAVADYIKTITKLETLQTTPVPYIDQIDGVGYSIPITEFEEDYSTNNQSTIENGYYVGRYFLTSRQHTNTYTTEKNKYQLNWYQPAKLEIFNQHPFLGINSIIQIDPKNDFTGDKVYCFYKVTYNEIDYYSGNQYIPFNTPTYMIWDFTGTAWNYIGSPITRLRDIWQEQYLYGKDENGYDPGKISKLSIICVVSADQTYVGGIAGKEFDIDTEVRFGDVIIYTYGGDS